MQIGSTELLIILIIIIAYGFYQARHSSASRSSAFRAGQGTQNGPAGAESPGSAWSEGPSNNAGAANTAGARDPYVVLNVPRNATKEEVVVAYKKLAQIYHPDKVAGLAPEYHLIAEQKMKEINTAYEQIRNRGWR